MRVFIKCDSPLLQKSMYIFLKPFVTSFKHCDFIISDRKFKSEKPLFIIGKDIKKPFGKDELLKSLNKFVDNCKDDTSQKIENKAIEDLHVNKLDKDIEKLTAKFSQDLVNLIKNYYEK